MPAHLFVNDIISADVSWHSFLLAVDDSTSTSFLTLVRMWAFSTFNFVLASLKSFTRSLIDRGFSSGDRILLDLDALVALEGGHYYISFSGGKNAEG